MAWYRTGTVSVTNGSATVTGSGTNFVANVVEGEGFLGPDGGTYEIEAVVSATQLTLATPYLGSSASSQNYKILPTQSALADLAVEAAELVSTFASVRDGVGQGLFPNGSVGVPGLRFASDQDTGIYNVSPNVLGIATGGVQRWAFGAHSAHNANGEVSFGSPSIMTFGTGQTTVFARGFSAAYPGRGGIFRSMSQDGTCDAFFGVRGDHIPSVGSLTNHPISFYVSNSERLRIETAALRPAGDNSYTLGTGAFRYSTLYAGTGTINTSDERDKAWRGDMSANEFAAGKRIIGELGFFQWNHSVEEKGTTDARLHFGVRAQAVWSIMQDCGLAGTGGESIKYGFLCYDEWPEQSEDGEVIREAGSRYGIRPDQLALFLIAVQARLQGEMADRVARLEATA